MTRDLTPARAKLHERAKKAEAAWHKTLGRKERDKLKADARTNWGRRGGNIIVAKAAPTRSQRKQRAERERLRAERGAYEALIED